MPVPTPNRIQRALHAAIGGILLVTAGLLATAPGGLDGWRGWLGLALLVAPGIEEIACAFAARRSLLARIGPLP